MALPITYIKFTTSILGWEQRMDTLSHKFNTIFKGSIEGFDRLVFKEGVYAEISPAAPFYPGF